MTTPKKIDKLFRYLSSNDTSHNLLIYGSKQSENYNTFMKYVTTITKNNEYTVKKLRITIPSGYETYIQKGNIHFELNMETIPNIKIWSELYEHLRDIMIATNMKSCIILCKNFHSIHTDILDSLYSLFDDISNPVIKFVILTRDLTFINESIRKRFIVIRPIVKDSQPIHGSYKFISGNIVTFIMNINNITYNSIRTHCYDILVNNLNPIDCVIYIIDELIRYKSLNINTDVLDKINYHIKGINKNYRVIYHLEGIIVYLILKVHGLQTINS